MIASIRHRDLKRLHERSDASGLRPDRLRKVQRLVLALDGAKTPEAMNYTGSGFHPLTGNPAGRYACTVSRNYRPTFSWDGDDATDVDLEDCHG